MSELLHLYEKLLKLHGYNMPSKDLRLRFLSDSEQSVQVLTNTSDYFNIKNAALHIPKESYPALPEYFIAQVQDSFKEKLILVHKTSDNLFSRTKDNLPFERVSTSAFLENWNGFVFAIEQNTANSNSSKIDFTKFLLPVTIFFLPFLYVFLTTENVNSSFLQLSLCVGVLISGYIIKEKYLSSINESSAICKLGKKTSCKSVINSQWALLFNRIELADAAFIFFIATSLFYLVTLSTGLVGFIAVSGCLIIPYASYHQVVSIKQWCPLCIGISIALLSVVGLSVHAISKPVVSYEDIALFITTASIVSLLWHQLKPIILDSQKMEKYELKYLRLWRSPGIAEQYLGTQPMVQIPVSELFDKVNNNNAVQLTLVTNPNCSSCKKIYQQVHAVLESTEIPIIFNHVFLVNPEAKENKEYQIVSSLTTVKNELGVIEMDKALSAYFEKPDINHIQSYRLSTTTAESKNEVEKEIRNHHDWCMSNGVSYTPCLIINDRILDISITNDEIESIIKHYYEQDLKEKFIVANTFIPAG